MDNNPKHAAKANGKKLMVKKWDIFQLLSPSPDLSPTEHTFQSLKTKQKTERPTSTQQLQMAAVKVE